MKPTRAFSIHLTATVFALSLSVASQAQWTYVVLNPEAFSPTYGYGVRGGQQVGYGGGSSDKAMLWTGTAASWLNICPANRNNPKVNGTNGVQQIGTVQQSELGNRASLWSGTAASWVDLTPAGATAAGGHGIDDTQQVGYATFDGLDEAGIWTGSANTWVSLAPGGSIIHSQAYGVNDGKQVGAVVYSSGPIHASLWSNTAASWVDLHPTGTGSDSSRANAVQGGQQVGTIMFGGSPNACMWSGTASSYVNLNPTGSLRSEGLGVWGGMQVGYADIGNDRRAVVWQGDPNGYTDLGAVLPFGYYSSYARGIWQDENHTYVIGDAGNSLAGTTHAILWIGPPSPSVTGFVNFDSLSDRAFQPNPVTLEFYDVGSGNPVGTRSVTLGSNGEFSTTPPQVGPLSVSVFEGTWLRRTLLVDTSGGSAVATFNLINGDCDHDNEVGIGDYALLSAAYGSAPGDPTWDPSGDLNRDESVDIGDYAILSANYGEIGD